MPHAALRLLLSLVATTLMIASTPAFATAQRTFVASYGVSTNTAFNCSIAKPCRAFSEALTVTSLSGEVIVLDSAGYGPVTITQSVSLIAPPGVYAGVSVFSGNGITLNTAGIDVVLKGLTITGLAGANGILMTNGSSLRIENCTVTGFPSSATAAINIGAAAKVFILDTVVANSNVGIVIDGGANAEISRVKAIANIFHGIVMAGTSNAKTILVVSETTASENAVDGIQILGQGAGPSAGFGFCTSCIRKSTVVNSVASGNSAVGMEAAGPGATLYVSNSVSANNNIGLFQAIGGVVISAQNNLLTNNGAPTSGTITIGGVLF